MWGWWRCKGCQVNSFAKWIIARAKNRAPDFVIGGGGRPYLYRWWLIARHKILNIYLHRFMRSDDDRALHDHPWANLSVVLDGAYLEHTIAAGGIHQRRAMFPGDWRLRPSGRIAHRIELYCGDCWSLFITGPTYREWGFHCPEQGWIHWKEFT